MQGCQGQQAANDSAAPRLLKAVLRHEEADVRAALAAGAPLAFEGVGGFRAAALANWGSVVPLLSSAVHDALQAEQESLPCLPRSVAVALLWAARPPQPHQPNPSARCLPACPSALPWHHVAEAQRDKGAVMKATWCGLRAALMRHRELWPARAQAADTGPGACRGTGSLVGCQSSGRAACPSCLLERAAKCVCLSHASALHNAFCPCLVCGHLCRASQRGFNRRRLV